MPEATPRARLQEDDEAPIVYSERSTVGAHIESAVGAHIEHCGLVCAHDEEALRLERQLGERGRACDSADDAVRGEGGEDDGR